MSKNAPTTHAVILEQLSAIEDQLAEVKAKISELKRGQGGHRLIDLLGKYPEFRGFTEEDIKEALYTVDESAWDDEEATR
ncbi:hypothetical protein IIA79_06990 [bacterium]|nr:hypothetical protein [bacterium]